MFASTRAFAFIIRTDWHYRRIDDALFWRRESDLTPEFVKRRVRMKIVQARIQREIRQ
jgi:hypothetical protein